MAQVRDRTSASRVTGAAGETVPAAGVPSAGQRLAASLRELLAVTIDRVADFASEKVEQVAAKLERVAQDGGPRTGALIGGVRAKLAGGNLVWGALKGAFGSLSVPARVGLVVLLVLALVLLPVTLVLALLALIVVAVVLAVRSRAPA